MIEVGLPEFPVSKRSSSESPSISKKFNVPLRTFVKVLIFEMEKLPFPSFK